jgi:hypothetical protein
VPAFNCADLLAEEEVFSEDAEKVGEGRDEEVSGGPFLILWIDREEDICEEQGVIRKKGSLCTQQIRYYDNLVARAKYVPFGKISHQYSIYWGKEQKNFCSIKIGNKFIIA